MDPLKLIALDGDDIEVVSAHLQDALVQPRTSAGGRPKSGVVVALNRFDWEVGQRRRARNSAAAARRCGSSGCCPASAAMSRPAAARTEVAEPARGRVRGDRCARRASSR